MEQIAEAVAEEIELSVIIPCHNEAETLPEQLEALLNQDWDGRWDIIVVDNGSTDETAKIASDYAGQGIDLRVVPARERAGVAYARNAGVRASTARSVVFCDGDDVVLPGWTRAMGEALRDDPLVTGTLEAEGLNEPWLAKTRPMGSKDRLPRFGSIPFARGNNTGMQRSLWDKLDGYDEDFRGLEDIEFSLRAASLGVVPTLVPEATVAYRFRTGLLATWRQGSYYGLGRSLLIERAEEFGLHGPTRLSSAKSWAWLVVKSPLLATRAGRYAWVFILANRLGALRGRFRTARKP